MTHTIRIRTAFLTAVIAVLAVFVSVPAGAAGAKDATLSKSELKNLVANAEKKADHERIANHFDAEAAKYEADAKEHGELAPLYQKNTPGQPTKYPGSMQTFQHCDSLSKALMQAAQDARALAVEHREMAKHAN